MLSAMCLPGVVQVVMWIAFVPTRTSGAKTADPLWIAW